MNRYTIPGYAYVADAYGAGTYDGGTYNCNSTNGCNGKAANDTGSNLLVNTGVAVGVVVTLACLVLLVAVLVRFWRRPDSKAVRQEGDVEPNGTEDVEDQTKRQL